MADNGGAFVALSGPGRLVHVSASGAATTWYEDGEDGLVTAVVPDGSGGVYFGVSGSTGRVMQATAPETIRLIAETGSQFVWSLLREESGKLWAATGGPGKIMTRLPGERWETVFSSGDDPVRCLAALGDGNIVAGTGLEGRILRIGPDGRAFVLLEAAQDEIVALAPAPSGRLYALATGSPARRGPSRTNAGTDSAKRATTTVRVTASSDSDPSDEARPSGESQRPPARPGRVGGALYRLDPDGGVWTIWETKTEIPFAVAVDASGFPVVATGNRGRIIRMNPDGQATRILRFPSDSPSALASDSDGRLWVGGTTDARLAAIGPELEDEAIYRSAPLDTGTLAVWGRIRWDADVPKGARLVVRLRSGNTKKPDETWSDWVEVETGAVGGEGNVGAPNARKLQLELELVASNKGASPRVRSLEVFYQPHNRPPRIERLGIGPPGEAWARGPKPSTSGRGPLVADDPVARKTMSSMTSGRGGTPPIRKAYEPGARTFSWTAKDPDGDELVYHLELRREGEDDWAPLAGSIEDEFYSWDARGLPDGEYRVRLTADDAPTNSLGNSYSDFRVSNPFPIDNTPPSIDAVDVVLDAEGFQVAFDASDINGRIAAAEFALDDGPWTFLDPEDGVADSETETYRFTIPPSAYLVGHSHLRLRVTDESGNVAGTIRPLSQ
jgi:sugar lactone lactonase YvrE